MPSMTSGASVWVERRTRSPTLNTLVFLRPALSAWAFWLSCASARASRTRWSVDSLRVMKALTWSAVRLGSGRLGRESLRGIGERVESDQS